MNLLILNYSMNPKSVLFSHQRESAIRLSANFQRTFVVTASGENENLEENLQVFSSQWKPQKTIKNILTFYRIVLPILIENRRKLVVFSHMTEVQSLLISPICRLLNIKHYLWYAHKAKSKYLFLSLPFLNGIITSTSGSCPIKGPKVHAIGQAIDEKQFAIVGNQPKNPALSWYHVGRLDESKNIHIIIAVFKALRQFGWQLSLDFYGEPSKGISESYFKSLLPYFESSEYASWLRCHGTIKRSKISEVAKNYDGFVHAFEGSLDKALLEAVMCRRVVVSINSEFLRDFESGKKCDVKVYDALMKQMLLTLNLSTIAQLNLLDRYWEIAKAHHSLDGWIERVTKVLSVQ